MMDAREAEFHAGRVRSARQTGRWPWQRKASLLMLLDARLLTPAQAAARYGFSDEELAEMRRRYDANGPKGLRLKELQGSR